MDESQLREFIKSNLRIVVETQYPYDSGATLHVSLQMKKADNPHEYETISESYDPLPGDC